MRTYDRHFEGGRGCESPGCRLPRVRIHFLVDGSLYRCCTLAHAEAAHRLVAAGEPRPRRHSR